MITQILLSKFSVNLIYKILRNVINYQQFVINYNVFSWNNFNLCRNFGSTKF